MSILWPLILPLLTAALIAAFGRWRNLRDTMSVVGGIATLLAAISLLQTPQAQLQLADFGFGMAFVWQAEPLGLLFSLLSAALWPITALYAVGYMRGANEAHQTRFFLLVAVSIAAAQCIALAGNLFTLFIGYEVLSLATWPLVAHKGTEAARAGGRTYLGYLLPASVALFLPAILIVQQAAGRSDFVDGGVLAGAGLPSLGLTVLYAMFLLGIAKAGLMPLHRWLPAAMVAPTPVSALLHAVAVVKAGVFCVLKISVYIFGIDLLDTSDAALPMLYLACFSLLAASLIALRSDNLKQRLAYSTVSQLAYVVVGATIASKLAVTGAALHIVAHALGKITLFFCAGAIYVAAHKTRVSELDGLGWRMPLTFVAFTLAALSIIGLPPLGGTWSKWLLMLAAQEAGLGLLMLVLAVSSLLNLIYLLEIPLRGFLRPSPDGRGILAEAPVACTVPLMATALACVALFALPGPILALLSPWSGS